MASERLRIGITIGLQHEAEDFWNNGIKQNALFLSFALANCPQVQSVRLVNTTAVPITPSLGWDITRWPLVAFDDVKDDLDLLIELGGQVSGEQTAYLKTRGARLVSYCCGSEYVAVAQSILFGRPTFGSHLFVNPRYDGIWMIPQIAELSEPYFTTLRRHAADTVPFVWDPVLVTEASASFANEGEYRPRPGARRLLVTEPNVDVVKFCLYPVLIAEEVFRTDPELFGFLHVTNADRLATGSPPFVALMGQLDVVRKHKASFVQRFATPRALAELADVVVCHQWQNPLNYQYLEVCWLGYPLVHNADLCHDIGYFYPGNDVAVGAEQALKAMREHDSSWEAYTAHQRRQISRFLPHDPKLVGTYASLIARLMAQPIV